MGRPKFPHKSDFASTYMFSIHDWRPGKAAGENKIFTHHHKLDYRVADGFHVYGCEWAANYLKFYEDGNLVYSTTQEELGDAWILTNPLEIWFDSETFPWMGLPEQKDLPVDFEIEYIRVWQKPEPNLLDRAFFGFEGPIALTEVPKPKQQESELKPWYIGERSSSHFAIVDGKFASGRKSLKFTQHGKLSTTKVAAMAPYGAVRIPAGGHTISMKVWPGPGCTVARIRAILEDPWLEISAIDLTGMVKGEWATVSQTFARQMPSTARDRLRLVVHDDDVSTGSSTLYIDDISITAMVSGGDVR